MNPTARRRVNHIEFFKIFITKVTRVSSSELTFDELKCITSIPNRHTIAAARKLSAGERHEKFSSSQSA